MALALPGCPIAALPARAQGARVRAELPRFSRRVGGIGTIDGRLRCG
jgi:hypothetical protein